MAECNDVNCCDSTSSKEMSRPQYGCPSFATPRNLVGARGLVDARGETELLCQEHGKKRTAKGRMLGTLAQAIAVLTSATDQSMGEAPVSESQVSRKASAKSRLLTSNIHGTESIKPRKAEYPSHEGARS